MPNSDEIPLMYRAQLPERGKIQYAGKPEAATKWVEEWLQGCPNNTTVEAVDESIPIWKRPAKDRVNREYTFNWRMTTNAGQDESCIRPVIGAKGLPYYPGASMKGAFLRICTPEEALKYCGGEVIENGQKITKPGILRFHGGYPINISWADKTRLVDIVHPQEKRQIIGSYRTSANVQISLYQPTFKFGISSNKTLPETEWEKIKNIWEKALAKGIGSRVSAGYGYVKEAFDSERIIISVYLQGQGLTSNLLNKEPEFRPNIFKAALRGHTLRLLAGITDKDTAQKITKKLWGGFEEEKAIVGKLGINFTIEDSALNLGVHEYNNRRVSMPTYDLKLGRLDIIATGEVSPEEREKLKKSRPN